MSANRYEAGGRRTTRRRVVQLPMPRLPSPRLHESTPSPLEEMKVMARRLAAGDAGTVTEAITAGRRHLQQWALDELYRLTGQIIVEVAAAQGLAEKTARAVSSGSRLIEARPPAYVIEQCADPTAFVAQCEAACEGVIAFLTGELRDYLDATGATLPGDPRAWIMDVIAELREALAQTADEDIDRKSNIVSWFVREMSVQSEPRLDSGS